MRYALLFALLVVAPALGQEWKPAPTPLMTRWGKAVTPENAHREYPRPTMMREKWQNLNGLWQFAPAKEGEAPPFGKELPERILVPFPVESALSGIGRREERMWYRRTFDLPTEWTRGGATPRVVLHLDAVDWEATVYVNGKELGVHRGGYDRISLDITAALKAEGPQELVVGVWDPTDAHWQPRGKQVRKPEGIWYTPSSGIWQTVWIETTQDESLHLERVKIEADARTGRVVVRCWTGRAWGRVVLTGSVSRNGVELARRSTSMRETPTDLVLTVPNPELWSPEHPTLYDVAIQIEWPRDLGVGEPLKTFDVVSTQFAFRTVELKPDTARVPRVHLNGEPVFLVGPLDQGFWPDGLNTPPSDEAMIFDIEAMKRLGFNAVRKHVKVEPERWYYHCDRLGLFVIQDMPSGDGYIGPRDADFVRSPESAAQFEVELKRLIEDRGRHPSIVTWVVFNEGWGQSDTAKYTDFTRRLDPTRLIISASGWTDRGTGDFLDLHTYPGPGPMPPAEQWGGRACIIGEFGGLGLGLDGHTWQKEHWGYKGAADRDDLTFQYVELLRRLWELKSEGLSGGIYTQLTDVEVECNGLYTYDREVLKVDLDRVARANRGLFPRVEMVLATSEDAPTEWRYKTTAPPDGWHRAAFDDSAWSRGPAGFGTAGTPGAVVGTEWNTPEIWVRRGCDLAAKPTGEAALLIHHDEDAEVYLNGVLAAKVTGYTTGYTIVPIQAEAAATLKAGANTLAIHCRQTRGGQYIDAGIVQMIEKEE
ncbi:MAG: glycoside hydrolase family 2 protein [Phycisphaerales bacterium]